MSPIEDDADVSIEILYIKSTESNDRYQKFIRLYCFYFTSLLFVIRQTIYLTYWLRAAGAREEKLPS